MHKRIIMLMLSLILQLGFFSMPGWGDQVGEISDEAAFIKSLTIITPILIGGLLLIFSKTKEKRLFKLLLMQFFEKNKFLLSLYALGIFSSVWSAWPFESLARSLSSGIFCISVGILSALYVIYSNNYRIIENVLIDIHIISVILLSALLFISFVNPEISYRYDGRLGGVIIPTNNLGAYCAAIIILAISALKAYKFNKVFIISGVVSIIVLYLTHSRTSSILALIIGGFASLYCSNRNGLFSSNKLRPVLIVLLISFVVAILGFNSDDIIEYLLRDNQIDEFASGSDRTNIWSTVLEHVTISSFVFGHGYAMLTEAGSASYGALTNLTHAHNGYLQVFAGLGIIGLMLLFLFIVTIFKFIFNIKKRRLISDKSLLYYFVFLLMHNISEASFGFQIYPQLFFFLLLFNATVYQSNVSRYMFLARPIQPRLPQEKLSQPIIRGRIN